MVGAFLIWVRSGFGTNQARLVRLSYKLQLGWGNLLWESVRVIFRLRIEIEGLEVARPGPILILARHASIIDNVLPFQLFSRAHGMTLRYVIKKELLMDPALDIAGSWLPNHFVDRQAKDPDAEIKALRRLGSGLTENDGLLIFPEGTRFTTERQERALASLAKRKPALLPPRRRPPPSHAAPPGRGTGFAGGLLGRCRPRRAPRIRRVRPGQGHLGRGHGRKACEGQIDEGPFRARSRKAGATAPSGSSRSGRRWTTGSPAWTRTRRGPSRRLIASV